MPVLFIYFCIQSCCSNMSTGDNEPKQKKTRRKSVSIQVTNKPTLTYFASHKSDQWFGNKWQDIVVGQMMKCIKTKGEKESSRNLFSESIQLLCSTVFSLSSGLSLFFLKIAALNSRLQKDEQKGKEWSIANRVGFGENKKMCVVVVNPSVPCTSTTTKLFISLSPIFVCMPELKLKGHLTYK